MARYLTHLFGQATHKRVHLLLGVQGDAGSQFLANFKSTSDYLNRIESLLWTQLGKAQPKSDFQKLWFDVYISITESKEAKNNIYKLLQNKIKFKGLIIDQDRRWNIIVKLNELDFEEGEKLRTAELKKDKSENGQKAYIASEVIRPYADIKRKWFKTITVEKTDLSLARQKTVMGSLFPNSQLSIRKEFSSDFYSVLPKLTKEKDNQYLRFFTQSLTPTLCTEESAKTIQNFIQSHSDLPPVVMKNLRIKHQEDERCVRIRQLAQSVSS